MNYLHFVRITSHSWLEDFVSLHSAPPIVRLRIHTFQTSYSPQFPQTWHKIVMLHFFETIRPNVSRTQLFAVLTPDAEEPSAHEALCFLGRDEQFPNDKKSNILYSFHNYTFANFFNNNIYIRCIVLHIFFFSADYPQSVSDIDRCVWSATIWKCAFLCI